MGQISVNLPLPAPLNWSAAIGTSVFLTGVWATSLLAYCGDSCPAPNSWTFSVAYWAIAGLALFAFRQGRPLDLLAPLPGLLVLLYLYSLASGLAVDAFAVTIFGDPILPSVRRDFYVVCLVGAVGLVLGSWLANVSVSGGGARAGVLRTLSPRLVRNCCWLLGAGATALFLPDVLPKFGLAEVQSYSATALERRVARFGDPAAGVREFISVYVPVTLLLSAAVMTIATCRNKVATGFSLLIIGSYFVANSLAGSRRFAMEALALCLVILHYRWKRIGLALALVLGAGVYLFVNVLSIARISSDPVAMVEAVAEHWRDVGPEFLALTSSGELLTGANLHRLMQGLHDGDTTYTYGQSIADEILVFVPQTLLEDRPLPLAERFVDVFYPGVRESGAGYGFFILQEGFWAFGIAGVLVTMMIYSYGVQRFHSWCVRDRGNLIHVTIYGLCYGSLILSSVRTGILAAVKSSLMTVAPLLAAILVAITLSPSQRADPESHD
jgi:hypothetical protein